MVKAPHKRLLVALAASAALLSPLSQAHFDDQQMQQSYRQSWFTLVAMNFGPMVAMVKGEMPWDESAAKNYAADLDAVVNTDLLRAFSPGSDKGTTRAKPEIWQNSEDFSDKLDDFRAAVAQLNTAAQTGDKKAIAGGVAAAGKTCKGCHDDYKSKEYLY
jgi:cytochrome c556